MRVLLLASKQLGLKFFVKIQELAPNHQLLIVHPDDTNDARSVMDEFRNEAKKNEVTFMVEDSKSEVNQIIRDFQPDLVFVCGWYSILESNILNSPRFGAWGIHHSLLPKYRGFAPLVWAIINGEEKVGSTFFRLNSGVDSGDVLFQVEVAVAPKDGISEVLENLEKKVLDKFENYLPNILSGHTKLTPQNEVGSSYFPRRTSKDGEIDWRRDAVDVHNFVRAQSAPYPGAFSFVGEELIFFKHQLFGTIDSLLTPGTILSREKNELKVKTGNSSFVVVKIDLTKTNINIAQRLQEGLQFNGL